ncbi:GTPase HflX [Clostridiales bacterium BX7]|uniref:GTPase HflX n=1 Tax=Feifania hominis TaxID=2763660 RepID=A0A926DCT2_9FIRM|nr:GTPase HflX [Feifania hominis]
MNLEEQQTTAQRAVLVGLNCSAHSAQEYNATDATLAELRSLAETAGAEVVGIVTQNRVTPDPKTLVGEGKAQEIGEFVKNTQAQLVIFDNELTPSQIKNLEAAVGVQVIDRSMLILDIFALHATSREGKLQVEMAQLKYTLPRLMGRGTELSRLGGGIGTRGPGESKLEQDRRHIKTRVSLLRAQLEENRKNRAQQRKSRDVSGMPKIAVIGYTNAGKSTLLNALTGAGVLVEDKLFATLDPTTRKLKLANNYEALLTDTVGFIRNLPHHLIEAFSSTLDEVRFADLLLHVVDVSNPDLYDQMEVSQKLIEQLGAAHVPVIVVFNKADLAAPQEIPNMRDSIAVSAATGAGLDELLERIYRKLSEREREIQVLIPYDQGALLEGIFREGKVSAQEHRENGTYIKLRADEALAGRLQDFRID